VFLGGAQNQGNDMMLNLILAAAVSSGIHLGDSSHTTGLGQTSLTSTSFIYTGSEQLRFKTSCADGVRIVGSGENLNKSLKWLQSSNACVWIEDMRNTRLTPYPNP
jgi:hypothetical protein